MCDYISTRRRNKKPKSRKTDPFWSKKIKNNSSRSRFDEKGNAWLRFHEKRYIHDEIKYNAVDQVVVSDISSIPWKTNAHFYKSTVPNGPNSNQHNRGVKGFKTEKEFISRNVNICKIHKNLYISDIYYNYADYDVIVNIGSERSYDPHHKMITLHMNDGMDISYQQFRLLLEESTAIISSNIDSGKTVLVNCNAGVNRSVCVVIAYAISIGIELNESIKIIEESKYEKYKKRIWDTLTNKTFRTYIGKYDTDMNK